MGKPGRGPESKFGFFDHLDRDCSPFDEPLTSRLRLIEQIERIGFASFHLAEHLSTPLGMAESPSGFLTAAIARIERLRLGPLVYVLPQHLRRGSTSKSAYSFI